MLKTQDGAQTSYFAIMLIPAHIRLRYWFYPIGNTPAVDLLRHSPLFTAGRTTVLSLGCGDVRNVLFTLWNEKPIVGRSYTFTTCDVEPAILARNVFLLSFLLSDAPLDVSTTEKQSISWELYYHTVISAKALAALRNHLVLLLDNAQTAETWKASTYGAHLRFLSNSTLVDVIKLFRMYLNACDEPRSGHEVQEECREVFSQRGFDGQGLFLHGGRCAGIHALSSKATEALSDAFRGYWRTGVVAGNQCDVSALEADRGGFTNPLLRLSSAPLGNFALHYGSDPLLGYHLAAVFDDESEGDSGIGEELSAAAKLQFFRWCESFRNHVHLDTVQLYFHCGEAIGLCHALQGEVLGRSSVAKILHHYIRPWSSTALRLDADDFMDALGPFDVIDTSNISDHVGFLNLMPAIVPLLGKNMNSVLYVETLLRSSNQASKYLSSISHADAETVCLVAGVAPTAYMLGYSCENFGSEAVFGRSQLHTGSMSQTRFRVAWQRPWIGDSKAVAHVDASSQTAQVDPADLARWFFRWYLEIFSEFENLDGQLSVHLRRIGNPLSRDLCHYTRMTIVSLIGLARENIRCDWRDFSEALIDHIQRDQTLIVGSNSLQELCMLLHLSGIHTASVLDKSPSVAAQDLTTATACPVVCSIERYPEMPVIVAVALVVPRACLRVFDLDKLDRFGTPSLHMAIHCPGVFENSFFSVHTCFGELKVDEKRHVGVIEEDETGWAGGADLVAICLAPSFQFLLGDGCIVHVALGLNPSAENSYFSPILGPHLRIYDTTVQDRQQLHLLRALPGHVREEDQVECEHPRRIPAAREIPSAVSRNGHPERLTLRYFCTDENERKILEDPKAVVHVVQESPCAMRVEFASQSRALAFPFPVDGSCSRTRIARKQGWVEVTVRLSFADRSHGYSISPFPVVFVDGLPHCFGLSRVDLSRQPVMPPSTAWKYLSSFLGMTLSEEEHKSRQSPSAVAPSTRIMFELKESLAAIILGFIGQGKGSKEKTQAYNAFQLARDGNSDLLIFASALRHDMDSGSVCLDAYVVPLTDRRVRQMANALQKAVSERRFMGIRLSEGESALWKRLIPVMIERCRSRWQHRQQCEYRSRGSVCPLSVRHGEMPICACGEGQDVEDVPLEYAGFRKFATRIAIPALSAVPFREQMVSDGILQSADTLKPRAEERPDDNDRTAARNERCGHCSAFHKDLKACAKCGTVKYCNRECQSKDWKGHKHDCKLKVPLHEERMRAKTGQSEQE